MAVHRRPTASGHLALSIQLDYLVVGHVTRDLVDGTFTIGGTVSYSARTARALGCRVGVVTSASPDLDLSPVLDGVLVARSPATATTTFENIYTPDGRHQVLHSVAEMLVPGMVPARWKASIVHIGPLVRECSPALVEGFGDSFMGLTPQGWMRQWDEAGNVHPSQWEAPGPLLARADGVVLSEEDVGGDQRLLAEYATQTRLLVVTDGVRGCTVYEHGRARRFSAPAVDEVDPTGAGDIFAAAFFVALQRVGDAWMAAHFANCIAARSVTRVGLKSTPTPDEIARCERSLRISVVKRPGET